MKSIEELKNISNQVRRDIVRMTALAGSGHPGGSMSSADFMTALYFNFLETEPEKWTRDGKNHDVFILSAGHLTPMYYSVLARRGYFPVADLAAFRKFGSPLQGHPSVERGLNGITQCSGSLGQGLAAAAGIAIGKQMSKDDKRVYVLCGDGECEEGQIWETAMFAAHHKLDNIVAMTDWNNQQIDGTAESVAGLGDLETKWKAFGWNVLVCPGHGMKEILETFEKAKAAKGSGKPTMILFHTVMGQGVDFMAGTCKWHGKAPSMEQCEQALAQLGEGIGDF